MTNFEVSEQPPAADKKDRSRPGTRFSRALRAVSMCNIIPAVILMSGLIRGLDPMAQIVSDLVVTVIFGTFLSALILWLITRRTPRTMTWLILVALPIYILVCLYVTNQLTTTPR